MPLKSASLITLSIAGLLAGAPAMADTYTGCLTPGGTIVRVAPGDAPRGGICPKNHEEIILGGSGGSGGVRDVVLVVKEADTQFVPGGGGVEVVAECPEGKYVIGGGAFAQNGNVVLNTSDPDPSGVKWNAYFVSNDGGSHSGILEARAICATVDSYTLPSAP
jgi:hypothetical protein